MKLLTMLSSKINKSNNAGLGYLSSIIYLAPHKNAGLGNLCPHASIGCASACLWTAGFGRFDKVKQCRVERAKLWFNDRSKFISKLYKEILLFEKKCTKLKLKCAVRLNGTSDIPWEKLYPQIFSDFAGIQFYDYTKSVKRMLSQRLKTFPSNYHLTFSRSENNTTDCLNLLRVGLNVAVIFKKWLPEKWNRFKVYDGDKHDLRFLDKKGVCGLKAKGMAKKDNSGFVVSI